MIYKLRFMPSALKAFQKLDAQTREQFRKQLRRRLEQPIIEKYRLHGDKKGLFKIKLQAKGYRLIYKVLPQEQCLVVVKVERRDKVYKD